MVHWRNLVLFQNFAIPLLLKPAKFYFASCHQFWFFVLLNHTKQLVKLLGLREANHIEFCRIKHALDEILLMYRTPELNEILKLLIDPTWVATGLKVDFETLVSGCEVISEKIGGTIYLDGENDQKINSFSAIPDEFFEDMESCWKGRVKRIHIDDAFIEVETAAEALSLAVEEDFVPIISRIKLLWPHLEAQREKYYMLGSMKQFGLKGKRFAPTVWAGGPGEEQIKQLKPALDSKGRKVGEEWFTTTKVETALIRYHECGEKAKARVLELLRGLYAELQSKINIPVFSSMSLVIAKALFSHVRFVTVYNCFCYRYCIFSWCTYLFGKMR